jgi:hypothetical protein
MRFVGIAIMPAPVTHQTLAGRARRSSVFDAFSRVLLAEGAHSRRFVIIQRKNSVLIVGPPAKTAF